MQNNMQKCWSHPKEAYDTGTAVAALAPFLLFAPKEHSVKLGFDALQGGAVARS